MNTETKIIQTVHNGTTITYDESDNKWRFTLRDRDRSAESLPQAREIIDKPVPEKAKPFTKIPAWEMYYDKDDPRRVEVTGIGESESYRKGLCVWLKASDGKRRKERAEFRVYPSNPKNDGIFERILQKQKEINRLQGEVSELRQKLDPLVVEQE